MMPAPTRHCTNRKAEWISSAILIQIGLAIVLAPLFGMRVGTAAVLPLPDHWVAFVFLLIGIVSCLALYANGQWNISPLVRAGGCAIRMAIYIILALKVVETAIDSGVIYYVLFAWVTLAVIDASYIALALDDFASKRMDIKKLTAALHAARAS